MTCYACGRQPGDVCRNENGCTASDAPVHSSQPAPVDEVRSQPVDKAAQVQGQHGERSVWPFPTRRE